MDAERIKGKIINARNIRRGKRKRRNKVKGVKMVDAESNKGKKMKE